MTITESRSHALLRVTPDPRRVTQLPSGPLAAIGAAGLLLLAMRREKRVGQACGCAVLLCALGCGSSSSSTLTPVTPPAAPSDPTIVTITAAGGCGSSAVSHSVQIAVTFM